MDQLMRHFWRCASVVLLIGGLFTSIPLADTALYRERFIFAGERGHVHASSIV